MRMRMHPIAPERLQDPRALPFSVPSWRGDLPHLAKEGCSYFVTFCEMGAVPFHAQRSRLARDHDGKSKSIARGSEPDLFAGLRLLSQPGISDLVQEALLHFQAQRYDLHAWVVMPNHVHAVVTPYHGHPLSKTLHSWKSFTSLKINKALGRSGVFWESESFDHLIRTVDRFERFVRYTEANPVKAGLCAKPSDWPFSSAWWKAGRNSE